MVASEARTLPSPTITPALKDVCLFAHFDPDDKVDPYVMFYLKALREAGFSTVFTTPSNISTEDESRVREFCCDVIRRPNGGLDFGSWSDAFLKYQGRFSGRLLLANDSVYGPMGNLNKLLARLTAEKADFYGLVECNKIALHLQSWFLLFEPQIIASQAFRDVFEQDFLTMSKIGVVRTGEIGMTQRLKAAGFCYRALVTFSNRLPLGMIQFNPMHILWREVLEKEGVPFVKVEVLRDRVSDGELKKILQRSLLVSPSWAELISQHLDRIPKRHDPVRSIIYRTILSLYIWLMRTIYASARWKRE